MTGEVPTTAPLPRLAGVDEERLTGAELRRLTARVRAHNLPPQPGRVALDVAEVVISLALVVLYLWGFGGPVRELLGSDATAAGLGPGLIQALVLALGVVAGASVALRLGPAGLPAAGVRWWVPTPADRAGLASPSVVRALLAGVGAGLVVGGAPAALTGVGLAGIAADAALGGALGLAVVAVSGALQVSGAASGRAPGRVLDGLLAAVPVTGLGLALWGPAWGAWAAPWAVSGVLAIVGAVALVAWVRGLDRLRAGDLRARASAALQASAALLSLDGGGVSRALGTGPTASRAFKWVPRAARGPVGALLAADAVLLLRSPTALAALLALASAGAVAVQVPALADGIGLWAVLAVVGYAAALAGAGGARAAGENPRLDSLLPLGARTTRGVRAAWPVLSAGVVLLLVAMVSGGGAWLAVGAPAAVVLGAAAVRAAYRGPVRWDVPMIATPAGAFPTGLVLHHLKGPDLALLGTVPLAWAVVAGVTPALVVAQVVAAVVAVYRAAR
ncbi:hypothetical protein GCM10010413_12180 [Promicromonospora sukumoe]|uniref:ABC-2 type transport system permease protein n=1 Tax=Promicromonospora sukumoe TaxID=88382 RepID=A0A7W3PCG6_9MICO|nr:DUF6297 family protein [Promicromonospora sukumoe]MBA8806880.1 hypothetical protein [Promicromonospora sukumoe]